MILHRSALGKAFSSCPDAYCAKSLQRAPNRVEACATTAQAYRFRDLSQRRLDFHCSGDRTIQPLKVVCLCSARIRMSLSQSVPVKYACPSKKRQQQQRLVLSKQVRPPESDVDTVGRPPPNIEDCLVVCITAKEAKQAICIDYRPMGEGKFVAYFRRWQGDRRTPHSCLAR
jgi:hypothetical protein